MYELLIVLLTIVGIAVVGFLEFQLVLWLHRRYERRKDKMLGQWDCNGD